MSIAVCPGSFDPVTNGHLDVFRRAASLFDEVIVLVAVNGAKKSLFSAGQRVSLIEESLPEDLNIRVDSTDGLLVDYCTEVGATAIVKGLRGSADVVGETGMALLNRELTGIETIFVLGDTKLSHIASSLVKDVASHGGRIDEFVPPAVARALEKEYR